MFNIALVLSSHQGVVSIAVFGRRRHFLADMHASCSS
jgi:hypothetical protein